MEAAGHQLNTTTTPEAPGQRRFARLILAGSMLVMGACGIMYEYSLGSLGNHLMGSSHEQIFVVIGIMMFAMGVGAEWQRRFDTKLIEAFLVTEILLGLLGGISVVSTYAAFTMMSSYLLVLFSFAFIVGGLIGLEVPLLIRINERYENSLRANLGNILSMDYVGSLLGALLFAYVLLTQVGIDRIGIGLGLFNVGIAFVGIWYFWKHISHRKWIIGFGLATIALLSTLWVFTPTIMADLEQRTYQDPIVYRADSPYQHIVLTERDERLRMYINGQLQFDSRDEHIYHEYLAHVPMGLASQRKRVLILGGGDGLALREVLLYGDVEKVDLVDLDPLITKLAANHPRLREMNNNSLRSAKVSTAGGEGISRGGTLAVDRQTHLATDMLDDTVYETASVQVMNVDAELFLRQANGDAYDVVIIDFPDPHHLEIAKLYSLQFYRSLRGKLAPGAVLAVQSTSPYHARDAFLCIGKTMRAAGFATVPLQQNVPSFGQWGWHIAVVGDDIEARLLAKRLHQLQPEVPTRYLTPELIAAATAFGKGDLQDDHILINSQFRPTIVDYYRHAWRR